MVALDSARGINSNISPLEQLVTAKLAHWNDHIVVQPFLVAAMAPLLDVSRDKHTYRKLLATTSAVLE